MTPSQLVAKYCKNLSASQRKANEQFFAMVAAMTKEGGTYIWPDLNKSFIVRGGKFFEQA